MKRKKATKIIKDRHGNVHGEELKKLVTDTFSEPWGPRYLATDRGQSVRLANLTPVVLGGLVKRIKRE